MAQPIDPYREGALIEKAATEAFGPGVIVSVSHDCKIARVLKNSEVVLYSVKRESNHGYSFVILNLTERPFHNSQLRK